MLGDDNLICAVRVCVGEEREISIRRKSGILKICSRIDRGIVKLNLHAARDARVQQRLHLYALLSGLRDTDHASLRVDHDRLTRQNSSLLHEVDLAVRAYGPLSIASVRQIIPIITGQPEQNLPSWQRPPGPEAVGNVAILHAGCQSI